MEYDCHELGRFPSLPLPLSLPQVASRDGHARGECGAGDPRPSLLPHRHECSMYTGRAGDGRDDRGGRGGPRLLLTPRREVRLGNKVW